MPVSVLQAVLDGIRYPAFVIDRRGTIHFRNRSAKKDLEADGHFLDDPDLGLVLADEDGYGAFRAALEWFFATPEESLKTLLSGNLCLDMQRVYGERTLAVATFRVLSAPEPVAVGDVEKLLRLTPAQAKLSVAIFNGKSVKDYAREADMAVATVRWHLSRVLKRAACRNQSDLIRRIATLP